MILVSVSAMYTPGPGKAKLAVNEGWIVGQVTNGTGPVENAAVLYVMAMTGGGPLGATFTNSTGYYNLTVLGGVSYMVVVFHGDYYTGGGGATPPVGGTATVDVTLNPIAPTIADVTLTGYVLDGDGNPVPGGNVIGFVFDPLNGGNGLPMYGNITAANETTGRYTVNVITGSIGGGAAAMGYTGYGFIENTTKDPFESNHTYWLNITLSVPPSTDDAVVSGIVTDADTSMPLEGAVVTAEISNQFNQQRGYSNFTLTNTTGDYSMNLTNGSGRLYVQMAGYSSYQIQNFQINPGEHLVINVTLVALTSTISGNITDLSTGLPIAGASVYMMDSAGHFAMATANGSGEYVMDVFASSSAWVGASSDGYSQNISPVEILAGQQLWMDFGLMPLDAWLTGRVTDVLSGASVADASVQIHGSFYNSEMKTNSSGWYNITLLSGNYSADVFHPNYFSYHSMVQVNKGENTLDIQLMPMNPPATTRLYGWVNDTETGSGIAGAQVQVWLAPPFQGQVIRVTANGTGYYDTMVVPTNLLYLVTNNSYMHANGSINATGQTEIRLDVGLEPDPWGPNLTYAQSPTTNISWTNPTVIDVSVVEKDPMQFVLIQFMFVNASMGWSDYVLVDMLYHSFDPMRSGQNNLAYTQVGDNYTFHEVWDGQVSGGWLNNATASMYFASFSMIQTGIPHNGLRGIYGNSTMGVGERGVAWFNNITGDFAFFNFDNGSKKEAMPGDPTAWFSPLTSLVRLNESTGASTFLDSYPEGVWAVPGLRFDFNSTVPSGKYLTEFGVQDWGNRGNGTGRFITVDNDPPVADAGIDQTVSAGDTVTLDGTGSHDNVGIVNYTWVVDNGGTPVVLWGASPNFTFLVTGQYNVTLTVTDGAGHTSMDVVVITVAEAIPEFPTVVLPIVGTVALIAVYRMRRTEQGE